MANWKEYRTDPLFLFTAPLFKPDDDKRSRIQFATDNFFEVIEGAIMKTFAILLEPIFKIFKIFYESVVQTADGLFNIKAVMANMWDKWNKMTDPFMRRFNNGVHQFRVTFIKLYASMEKSFAVGVSSIYAGISTVQSILSFIDLIMTITIIILCILVVMMILLFFVLAPFLPLILTVLGVISGTAMAGAVGGMAGTFCFLKGTLVQTNDGPKPIESIELGDILYGESTVLGTMKFHTFADDLYTIDGVVVSGTHILYENDIPIHVSDHPRATKYFAKESIDLYCFNTSNRKIPIVSSQGLRIFADWEEISSIPDLQKWNEQVFHTLNPDLNTTYSPKHIPDYVLLSESVFSHKTHIVTSSGTVPIHKVSPGDLLLDDSGVPTKVLGVIVTDASQILKSVPLGFDSHMSCASWVRGLDGLWSQPWKQSCPNTDNGKWYSVFTESGSFQIVTEGGNTSVRDFTDLGPTNIDQSYDWVLQVLQK